MSTALYVFALIVAVLGIPGVWPRAASMPGRIGTRWAPTRIGPGGVDCDGNPWPLGLGGRLD